MYYQREIKEEGIPPILFRHPKSIQQDMSIIARKIEEVESRLSVRNLVETIIKGEDDIIDGDVISTVEKLLCDAERSIFHLERLRDAMEYFEEELEQARRFMKNEGL